jgi:hypothetical protein
MRHDSRRLCRTLGKYRRFVVRKWFIGFKPATELFRRIDRKLSPLVAHDPVAFMGNHKAAVRCLDVHEIANARQWTIGLLRIERRPQPTRHVVNCQVAVLFRESRLVFALPSKGRLEAMRPRMVPTSSE